MRSYQATRKSVPNRGIPPVSFLDELVNWLITAPNDIFTPRPSPANGPDPDIYLIIKPYLGPVQGAWTDVPSRRAAMGEVLLKLAALESSWNWNEGQDESNPEENSPLTYSSGVFQTSADSMAFPGMKDFAISKGVFTPEQFIVACKTNHPFAMEYCSRLLRVNTRWDGPIDRGELQHILDRQSAAEILHFLQTPNT
jgi:hypothetical protein